MNREEMFDTFLSLGYKDFFVVNKRYQCHFDFSKYYGKKSPLFTEFKKDENCPRLTAEVDVLVYDIENGEHLQGLVTLSIDEDLGNAKEASIYVKHLEDTAWKSGTTVIQMTELKLAITEDDCHSGLGFRPTVPASSKSFD